MSRADLPRRRGGGQQKPPQGNTEPIETGGPQFAEVTATPDPEKFVVKHGSDKRAYSILDHQRGKLRPRPFPVVKGTKEPTLELAATMGNAGESVVKQIQAAGQIVFHAVGDTNHPATDGEQAKTPDDFVTVNLADRKLEHFRAPAPRHRRGRAPGAIT
jgi:hypothetical protein